MHNAFRDTPLSTGLRQARRAPGFDDATAAARRFGWVVPTYLAHENGSRGFSFERSETYARAFKAHLGGLLTGEGSPGSAARIPVSGYVGAGAMIDAADETAGPDGIDKVELPPGEYGDFAAFKVRAGQPIGAMVTLRGDRMYEFFDRLVNVVLPRVRDFRGVSTKSFDGRGNYTLGLHDQLIFPEIDYARVDKLKGMNVTIVTTAASDDQARSLLRHLGMPFRA